MITALSVNAVDVNPPGASAETQEIRRALDKFLRDVERRALRIAELSTGNRDDALEIVQDSMLVFVRNYRAKPGLDWAPLFYRVLDSRIMDFHRRRQVRHRWLSWLTVSGHQAADPEGDLLDAVADQAEHGPSQRLADVETAKAFDSAIKSLPVRQRQCFLLRVWEGLDVAQTAHAMQCSEGSVKTHLSRAMAALRLRLEPYHE